MEVLNILKAEREKPHNLVRMYREGVFYTAYEHSAFLFCKAVHNFKVKKRFVRKAGCEIASTGFPTTSLEKWTNGLEAKEADGVLSFEVKVEEAETSKEIFTEWKEQIPLYTPNDTLKKNSDVVREEDTQYNVRSSIIALLRNFPLEQKTPLECMLFISELKKMIGNVENL